MRGSWGYFACDEDSCAAQRSITILAGLPQMNANRIDQCLSIRNILGSLRMLEVACCVVITELAVFEEPRQYAGKDWIEETCSDEVFVESSNELRMTGEAVSGRKMEDANGVKGGIVCSGGRVPVHTRSVQYACGLHFGMRSSQETCALRRHMRIASRAMFRASG